MGTETPSIKIGSKALEKWKDEIRAGLRYRRIFGRTKEWKTFKNMYRGLWRGDVIPVNIVYAIGRSLIPQIYFRNPRVGVVGKKPGFGLKAQMVERIDRHILDETDLKSQLKSLILDNYLMGVGPLITGYDTEFGFNPSFNSEEFEDSSLTSFNKKGEKIEYTDNVKPGMPWALRCNPQDFVVPWGTRRFEEARWFAFRKMRTLKDIKEDPKYKNTSSLKAQFTTVLDASEESHPNQPSRQNIEDPVNEWVEVFQVHDKRSGRVFTLSLAHDKFMRDEIDFLQVEHLPAHVLTFNEDPDYFWAPPDVRMIQKQQEELNHIRTMASVHRKLAVLKVIYDKNLLGKDELAKFLDGDPKAAVGIDAGTQGDIRKVLALVQSHVPPDLTIQSRETREDVRETLGFSRNQQGAFESTSGRRTATEAAIVKQASQIRIDERRDAMADILSKTMRTMNQYIFANWTEERVVDIVGPDGARHWVQFTGAELKGEYAYRINPEEAIPSDQQTRKQDAIQFIQLAMQAQNSGMDVGYLLKSYAEQFDWIDPKLLFPGNEAGRSPERPIPFPAFQRQQAGAQSSVPGL